tara:strand:- start:37 stop:1668 length:1632 start_codon:yes stop_codon:yes gene_type:complete
MAKEFKVKLIADADEAIEKVDELKQGVQKTNQAAANSKSSFDKMKGGISAVNLAFKAMGIGIILNAFMDLKEMLSQNQVVMDNLSIATETVNAVFQKVIQAAIEVGQKMTGAFTDPKQAIADLWQSIKQNLVDRMQGLIDSFGALGGVIKGVFTRDMDLLKESLSDAKTGFIQLATGMTEVEQNEFVDKLVKTKNELVDTVTEANKYAQALVALRNEVKLAEANQRQLQLAYQKDAELQRQIRDDISLTFEERIAANEELGRILDEQFAEEQALAQRKVELAQMEADQNQGNIDLQVALINAKTELIDLEERITGQKSEQLTNLRALEQEQADEEQARIDAENQRLADEQAARDKELEDAQAQADALKAIEDQKAADLLAIQQAREDASRAMIVSSGQDILSSVSQLAGEGTATAKAAALAGILIDTARGISGAIAAGAGVPFPANLGAIFSGVATVLAGIAQAKAVFAKVPGGGGGGGGDDNVSMPTPSPAAAGGMGPLVPNMENVEQPTVGGDTTVQAFVVENDISNAQALQQELDTQATL